MYLEMQVFHVLRNVSKYPFDTLIRNTIDRIFSKCFNLSQRKNYNSILRMFKYSCEIKGISVVFESKIRKFSQ